MHDSLKIGFVYFVTCLLILATLKDFATTQNIFFRNHSSLNIDQLQSNDQNKYLAADLEEEEEKAQKVILLIANTHIYKMTILNKNSQVVFVAEGKTDCCSDTFSSDLSPPFIS